MAQAAGAANAQGGKDKGSTPGLITGLALFICIPLFIFGGSAIGSLRSGLPNPGGATTPQAIDPRPNGALSGLLTDLKTVTGTDAYLRANTTTITDYLAKLTLFAQKLTNNDSSVASIQNKDKVQAQVQIIIADLNAIQAAVSSQSKTTLPNLSQKLRDDISKLDALSVSSIFTLAKSLAAENEASGYTKYRYSQDHRTDLYTTGTGYSDCSAYVSYLLYKGGNKSIPQLTTQGLYEAAKNGRFGLKIVAESTSAAGLPNAQITSALQPGDTLLSGSDVYANGGGSDSSRHAVMFIGDNTITESTSSKGKNGIQSTTVEDRLTRKNQVIIRWSGLTQS